MARIFQRRPNGIYWIDYVADGKRIRESTGTHNKKLAEQCLQSRLGDIVQGKFKVENRKPGPLFADFLETYLQWAKQNKRSWERDQYSIQNLKPFFGNRRLNAIHSFHVESYRVQRKEFVKPATINREVALLKRILNLAVEWGVLASNPISNFKMYKESIGVTTFLSEEEAQRLIAACRGTFQWIVITALHTGMRKNEILTLCWSQVDLKKNFLTLTRTKNGEIRYIPLDRTLRKLFAEIPRRSEFVFAKENGKPYSWIGRAWKNALAEAGVNCRFHDLRHTFASHLAMKSVDLYTIKELLGHKSMKMVQRYAHLSDEHKRRAIEALDHVFSEPLGTKLAHEVEMAFSKSGCK
ncbi:MAG TPA: tyrosine-type recombinase/integrase [bacterium]|nr:tyrosine-type recombinase/integrase [bacterium]HNT67396.1 tyrosine-type recombinase/integrase [bacterium]